MKKRNLLWLATAFGGVVATGCSKPAVQQTSSTETAAVSQSEPEVKGVGLNMANLDRSVSPCEDFNLFANGGWLKNNPIPASESRWGSFNELADNNNKTLRAVVDAAVRQTNASKGSSTQLVGDFYAAGMDSAAIEKAGLTPLKPELDRINAIKDRNSLLQSMARLKVLGRGGIFSFYVGQDDKISTQYIVNIGQSGLGLPDRDYYTKTDARSKSVKEEYQKHVANMFQLLGDNEATARKNAAKVVEMETRLANASMTRVQQRDPHATYNKMTVADLQKLAPNFNWPTLLKNMNVTGAKEVIVGQPNFLKEANTMLTAVPVSDWKTYLRWHLARTSAAYLPQAFVQESFNFNSKFLSGAKEMQPRWKRVLRMTDGTIGEALGQEYVDKAFSPQAKAKALEMVNNLRSAFQEHVKNLDWMSEATKQQALGKLNAFAVKIGYPEKWETYAGLTVSRTSYLQNVLQASEWGFKDNVSKLGKPVDRSEWGMTPPTVNAYYNPSMNEIVFPAGILQPPFFDPNADDAVNYGGMGAVIGHELTHGFDDQGSQYDPEGNLRDWWTAEDKAKFKERTDMVDRQYSAYQPLDSVNVNGKLTMGENIADIGGLNIAFTALQKAIANKNVGKIDEFTPEQRFFLAWAQIWRNNSTPAALRQQVLTDPHSPAMFRINGPLSNMPQFYKAFNCGPGNKMYRPDAERVHIW
ncbi:M13 family metallopeptidase [Rufibacter sediminis]|uniref:M13 family metallopeptidase n=1 Tax=Rufibacter sediminis TaxID=2762756 RepID=A0ABR6VXR9_9BACT|nr:M13 family metallopeptidase [Rufibacter sediminis]MBC3541446.1 M13 family metallopeptidase [Rufibacter sediminis]